MNFYPFTNDNFQTSNYQRIIKIVHEGNMREKINLLMCIERVDKEPVGLLNYFNICYLNCLLQTYFRVTKFVYVLLNQNRVGLEEALDEYQDIYYDIHQPDNIQYFKKNKNLQNMEFQEKLVKKFKGLKLIYGLQNLFGLMRQGNKKILDARKFLDILIKQPAPIIKENEQMDFNEFNLIFLDKLKEAFQLYEQHLNSTKSSSIESSNGQFVMLDNRKQYFDYKKENLLNKVLEDEKQQSKSKTNNSGSGATIIEEIFFGKFEERICYLQNEDTIKNQSRSTYFYSINLDIHYETIEKSLEHALKICIENYQLEDTHQRVSGFKEIYIKFPPQILTFTLNRISYDREIGTFKKLNDVFSFPFILNIGKYLVSHREVLDTNENQIIQLQKQQKQLQQNLLNYNNTGQTLQQAIENLKKTIYIIKSQSENDVNSIEKNILNQPINYLDKILQTLELQEEELNKQIIHNQIEQDKITKPPEELNYELFSIIIHAGDVGGGHYYCYVYDEFQKNWLKYNDISVTQVNQENVFRDAYGYNSNSAAYALFYKKQKTIPDNDLQIQLNLEKNSESNQNKFQSKLQSYYHVNMPIDQKLEQRITNFNFQNCRNILAQTFDLVIRNYQKKYDQIRKMYEQLKFLKKVYERKHLYLCNVFIFILDESKNNDDIVKYQLLSTILREVNQDINFLGKNLEQIILDYFMQDIRDRKDEYAIHSIEYIKNKNDLFERSKYQCLVYNRIIILEFKLLKCLRKRDWNKSLSIIQFITNTINLFENSQIQNLSFVMIRYIFVVCLKLCQQFKQYIENNIQEKSCLELIDLLTKCKSFLQDQRSQKYKMYIQKNIQDTINQTPISDYQITKQKINIFIFSELIQQVNVLPEIVENYEKQVNVYDTEDFFYINEKIDEEQIKFKNEFKSEIEFIQYKI